MDLARLAGGVLHVAESAPAPVALAAGEIGAYLARIFGRAPERRTSARPGAWLCLAAAGRTLPERALTVPEGAEHAIVPADDAVALTGTSPRALLAAAYALLEAAGCRWSPDGAADEYVPEAAGACRDVPAIVARPPFARRAWAADLATWHCSMPERLAERLPSDLAFVDWMARTGATGLLFIRHANDTAWAVDDLLPALARRGLDAEVGGHALVELLPRALFAAHPEYFPIGPNGRRSDLGNVCTASRAALALVAERAGDAHRAVAPAGPLHVWGLDLLGGGWCACAACAGLTPSEQALTACNAVAAALEPPTRVFHLAYHDTLAAPERVAPHPRVWAEFAPRERCYAHPLDDPDCAANRPYRAAFERHLVRFDGRVEVFEYYGDAILFGGCAVPLADVVARDLDYYARAGAAGVSCLVFGSYSTWAYGVNLEAFARGARDPRAACEARPAYCGRRYGAAAGAAASYLAALERLMANAVAHGDVLLPPRHGVAAATVMASLDRIIAAGPRLEQLLGDALAAGPRVHLEAERPLLAYTLAVLRALRGWLADPDAPRAADAVEAALSDARRHVHGAGAAHAGTWGAYDLELTHHFFAGALRAQSA